MSRFIRVALAGCFVLGLSLLFCTPAAQAKGGGGHGSHGHSHSRGHNHRGRHVGYNHRRRYDRRYWSYGSYADDSACCETAPVAVSEDCGCEPVADGYDGASYGESYGGYYGRDYRHRRNHNHKVSHRGSRGRGSRGGHGGGHGRK